MLSQANLPAGATGGVGLGTMVINGMYESANDETLQNLPKISRSQITFGKFLGSGAFGEVFEGEFSKDFTQNHLKSRKISSPILPSSLTEVTDDGSKRWAAPLLLC